MHGIPLDPRTMDPGAHVVRVPRRAAPRFRPGAPRRWRRRGRRAQVSAVATILGLLLVVTFIANYLTTTLPNQMSVNDLNHDILVENQVGRLSATVTALATNGQVGGQTVQPITLGSDGDPPFASQDGGTVGPLQNGSRMVVNYTLSGPTAFLPPTGGPQGGRVVGTSCIPIPPASPTNSITCSGSANIIYNFTGALAGQSSYSLTLSGGGSALVNISSNHATVTVAGSSTTLIALDILGSNDTVSVTVSSVPENILIYGNYDSVTLTGSATAASFVHLLIVGNHDTVSNTASGPNTFVASIYGSNDVFNPGTVSGSNHFQVYFNGFNPLAPAAQCPVDNISGTDTVGSITASGANTWTVTYNNTVYTGSGTIPGVGGSWTVNYQIPTPFACPFYSTVALPLAAASAPGAGFVVSLRNTYAPAAQVAFDEGAVLLAQPGSVPVVLNGPDLTLSSGTLSLLVPQFQGSIGVEAGISTAVLALRLLSSQSFSFPTPGFSLQSGSDVTLTIVTPFAGGWMNYFNSLPSFSGLVTCTGANNVCGLTAPYSPGGPLGTIVVSVPAKSLSVTLAVFAVSLD